MPASVTQPPAISRFATVATIATIILTGVGVSFKITGNTKGGQFGGGSGSVLQIWSSSGAQVAKMNSSGSLVMSGTLVVGHRKTGSGNILIKGTDGARVCVDDIDGTGCTCFAGNNGTQQTWSGTAAECTSGDSQ